MTKRVFYPSLFLPLLPPSGAAGTPAQWFAPLEEPVRKSTAVAVAVAVAGAVLVPFPTPGRGPVTPTPSQLAFAQPLSDNQARRAPQQPAWDRPLVPPGVTPSGWQQPLSDPLRPVVRQFQTPGWLPLSARRWRRAYHSDADTSRFLRSARRGTAPGAPVAYDVRSAAAGSVGGRADADDAGLRGPAQRAQAAAQAVPDGGLVAQERGRRTLARSLSPRRSSDSTVRFPRLPGRHGCS